MSEEKVKKTKTKPLSKKIKDKINELSSDSSQKQAQRKTAKLALKEKSENFE